MQITFAHLCDYALVSREGKLSVMGIFSQINGAKLPLVHPQAYLAFELAIGYAEVGKPITIDIQIVDADGSKILGARVNGAIHAGTAAKPGESPQIGQILAIQNLTFPKFGTYNVNFFLNERFAKQVEFRVVQSPPSPAAGAS
jgi:hypothetical protein